MHLVSKRSCDKSSRVVSQNGVFVFDCVAIVSLHEAAGQTRPRQEEAARGHLSAGRSDLFWRPTQEREKLEWQHREQLRQVGAVRTTSRRRSGIQEEADTLSTGGTEMGGLKKCRKHNGRNQRGLQKQIQIKKEKTKVLRGL